MTKNRKKLQTKSRKIAEKREKQALKSHNRCLKELRRDGFEDILKTIEKLEINVSRNSKDSEIQCNVVPFERPSPRVSSSFNIHPLTGEVIIFGGEYYNGHEVKCFHDLIKWNIEKNEWKKLLISDKRALSDIYLGGPKPRCSHQSVIFNDCLFIHGGEYSTQNQFYHFKDLWKLNLKNYVWSEVQTTGLSPSPRSGHRMVVWRHYFVVFGGFHDTVRETRYYNDIHVLNTKSWHWDRIESSKLDSCPSPRSGVQMILCPNTDRIFIYGGYSKVKDNSKNSIGKIHSDYWFLDMKPYLNDGKNPVWEKITKKGTSPTPRSGSSIVGFKNQGIIFGGVFDQEDELGLNLNSIFYNDVFTFDLNNKRWFKTEICCKSKLEKNKDNADVLKYELHPSIDTSYLEDNNEVSIDENINSQLYKTLNISNKNECDLKKRYFEENSPLTSQNKDPMKPEEIVISNEYSGLNLRSHLESTFGGNSIKTLKNESINTHSEAPLPRINCGMFLKGHYIYIYGGIFELGRKSITLDDCWCFDVLKKDGWRCILPLSNRSEEWEESESEFDSDTDSFISSEVVSSSSDLYSEEEGSDFNLNFTPQIEKKTDKLSRQDIETLIVKYELHDLNRTPFSNESLKDFFIRTKNYWVDLSKDLNFDKDPIEKELSRNAFNLALERFNNIKPYLKLIKEIENKQNESEI